MELVKRYYFMSFETKRTIYAGRGGSVVISGCAGMSAKQARKLAKQLKKAAKHVEKGGRDRGCC